MKIPITLKCPRCQGLNIKKNGFNGNRKQKYDCKICKRCFIGDHALNNKGCHSQSDSMIWRMSAYGNGIRAICSITAYSRDKVQAALSSHHQITPKQKHYDTLQIDEFHTFFGNKKNKVWLIYAYHAKTSEIVAFVWGKRDLKT
ncbi:MAG: IS1 family transposase, partial [Conchiformibius sp.]|nr:IS1 family transposase [Conchiformibius sp.]